MDRREDAGLTTPARKIIPERHPGKGANITTDRTHKTTHKTEEPTTGAAGTGRRHGQRRLGWREAALVRAVRPGEDYGSEPLDEVLASVREGWPQSTCVLLRDVNRRTALRVLREELGDLRPIVRGTAYRYSERQDEYAPYAGWYAGRWRGERIEVALVPHRGDAGLAFVSGSETAAREVGRVVGGRVWRPEGRALVFSNGRWRDAPDVEAEVEKTSWEDIVLPEATVSGIRRSIERFFGRREAYREMGFAWRRGILLVGPPGTGKTMVCKAVAASRPDLHFLYVRDLDARDEEWAIGAIFERARRLAPVILAFEDIDGIVNEANRSVFLNELDGFKNNDGVLVIASSNHPERVDEALLKRPSRFDRVFHIGLPALEQREEYCRRLLSRPAIARRLGREGAGDLHELHELHDLARRAAERSEGFTPAHLKEAILSAALTLAHEELKTADDFGRAVLDEIESLRHYLKSARLPEKLGELRPPENPFGFRR